MIGSEQYGDLPLEFKKGWVQGFLEGIYWALDIISKRWRMKDRKSLDLDKLRICEMVKNKFVCARAGPRPK